MAKPTEPREPRTPQELQRVLVAIMLLLLVLGFLRAIGTPDVDPSARYGDRFSGPQPQPAVPEDESR